MMLNIFEINTAGCVSRDPDRMCIFVIHARYIFALFCAAKTNEMYFFPDRQTLPPSKNVVRKIGVKKIFNFRQQIFYYTFFNLKKIFVQ